MTQVGKRLEQVTHSAAEQPSLQSEMKICARISEAKGSLLSSGVDSFMYSESCQCIPAKMVSLVHYSLLYNIPSVDLVPLPSLREFE